MKTRDVLITTVIAGGCVLGGLYYAKRKLIAERDAMLESPDIKKLMEIRDQYTRGDSWWSIISNALSSKADDGNTVKPAGNILLPEDDL